MLTDDKIAALIETKFREKYGITYTKDPIFAFRVGLQEAARIAEEATSSAFPMAAHVAIRDAAREP